MKKLISFLFGWTTPFLLWFKDSLTGTDGKAEESKMGAWAVLALIIWTVKRIIVSAAGITMIHIYLLALLAILYLLLIGVIKFQEIIEGIKNIKHGDDDK